jgi:hypothetical protein
MAQITLIEGRVIAQDITDFYDGEWLTLEIDPGSPAGVYRMTIADGPRGRKNGQAPDPIYSFDAQGWLIDRPPADVDSMDEDQAYYYDLWRYADDRWYKMATGKITRRAAIRPVGVPAAASALTADSTLITADLFTRTVDEAA